MEKQKLSYPKSVYFILIHQIFERFSFWGITVILPIFLKRALYFDDDSATAIYHGYSVFSYLSSIIGAIIADSYFGKYRTILGFSTIYFLGTFLLTASATEFASNGLIMLFTMVGLILTGLAAGAIKPCITAFGGDQFELPQQQKQLDSYFPLLYLMVNISLFVSAFVMPILKRDVQCLGKDSCYSLAFALPCFLVIIASVTLWLGNKYYRKVGVNGNVVVQFLKCIKTAVVEKYTSRINRKHWLDHAELKFDTTFISHVKTVLNVLLVFIPVIVFWAVYEQQFSRWAFQASRMNGEIGSYIVAPEQAAMLNFVLTFIFIPVFEKIIFPLMEKCKLQTTSLQRIVIGFICSTLAFVACGFVELKIESSAENTVHMVWLLPQYILMSLAEVFLIPSMNSFAYSHAPKSMKSLLLMATLIPQALGNVVVIIVAKVKIFELQSIEFFFFAGINTCALIVLIILATRFKSNNDDITNDVEIQSPKKECGEDNKGYEN